MTANPGPSWMMFGLLVAVVAIIALFDQMCRPVVVPVVEPTPTLRVIVKPTNPPFLPATVTPTAPPPPTEVPITTPVPTATPTPAPTGTATPEPSPTRVPVTPVQRGALWTL